MSSVTDLGGNSNSSGTVLTLANINVPAGSHIVVFVHEYTLSGIGTLADGTNGSYTSAQVGNPNNSSTGGYFGCFYFTNSSPLSNETITYTKKSSGSRTVITASYISGAKNVAPTVSLKGAGNANSASISSGVLPDAATILYGAVEVATPAATDAYADPGSPWVTLTDEIITSYTAVHSSYQITSTTTSKTYTATLAVSAKAFVTVMIGWPAVTSVALTANSIAVASPTVGVARSFTPVAASNLVVGSPSIGAPVCGVIASIATGITVGSPTINAPSLGAVVLNSAFGVSVGSPVIDAPTITQKYVFSGSSLIVGSPSISVPMFAPSGVLLPRNLAVGSPAIGVASMTGGLTVSAVPLIVSSPTLGAPVFIQNGILVPMSIAIGSPAISIPALSLKVYLIPFDTVVGVPTIASPTFALVPPATLTASSLVVGSPVIGAPSTTPIRTLLASNLAPLSLEIDAPTIRQNNVLHGQALNVGSPQIAVPEATDTMYFLTPSNLALGSPSIGSPRVNPGVNLFSLSISMLAFVDGPQIGMPIFGQNQHLPSYSIPRQTDNSVVVGSPTIDVPQLAFFDPDPAVVCLTHQDDDIQEALFTNTNVNFGLMMGPMALVGRTDPGVGPAEALSVVAPLILRNRTLDIDLSSKVTASSLEQVVTDLLAAIASLDARETFDIQALSGSIQDAAGVNDVTNLSASIATLTASLNALAVQMAANYNSLFGMISKLANGVIADMTAASVAVTHIGGYFNAPNLVPIGPSIGAPTFVAKGPQQLIVGSPSFSAPVLSHGPIVVLPNTVSILVGSPTLGTPAMTKFLIFPAPTLVVGSPTFDVPIFGRLLAPAPPPVGPPLNITYPPGSLVAGSPSIGVPNFTVRVSNISSVADQGAVFGAIVIN